MSQISREIEGNFRRFSSTWPAALEANRASLSSSGVYLTSYRRITSLQAVRVQLIEPRLAAGSKPFLLEAQNDALVSHVSASMGGWRSALQSLRSCIENTLMALYYTDHPVELLLWHAGKHRITFSDLLKYFEAHPLLASVSDKLSGLNELRSEYAKLSKAVHASAASFRMTDQMSEFSLWSADQARASMWSTREGKSLESVVLLGIALFREHLKGNALSSLKDVLSLTIGATLRRAIKKDFAIHIPDQP